MSTTLDDDAAPVSPPRDLVDGDPVALAEHFSELARTLNAEEDLPTTLQAIVDSAVRTVEGAEHVSITGIVARREVTTLASTGEVPRAVDRAQYDTAQGPCLTSLFEQRTVLVTDLASDERWPAFAARAVEVGVSSVLAVRLYARGDDLGALNLMSAAPHAFDDAAEQVALLFASHASIAFAEAQEKEGLLQAVSTRDLIGTAKGILMERFGLRSEAAFELLIKASQDRNRKLHLIAEELVAQAEAKGPQELASHPS